MKLMLFIALAALLLAGCCSILGPEEPQAQAKLTEEPAQKTGALYPNFNNPAQKPDMPVLELNATKAERNASEVQSEEAAAVILEAELDNGRSVYYFHSAVCAFCIRMTPVVDAAVGNAGWALKKYEIYNNAANFALYTAFADKAGIAPNDRAVPVVFIGKRMLTGEPEIMDRLNSTLEECKRSDCGSLFGK
jgi:hypothetical protein